MKLKVSSDLTSTNNVSRFPSRELIRMWVVRAVICKLEFLGDEDEILTTDMLKVRCRTKCNVSVSVLTDPRCILNGRHVTQATKD